MTIPPRVYRLLIVDDDEIDRRAYINLLTRQASTGCEAVQAADGERGLALLAAGTFDCVLLDFNLPDMNGLEFLRRAVVDRALPCAIVLVTGQGSEAVAVDSMKQGVQDYLPKDRITATSLWRAVTQAVLQVELRKCLDASLRELTAANAALEHEVATRKATEVELRAAKVQADLASEAKTRFAAMVTHELRTPLNGILGYAQLLRIEGGLAPAQAARIDAMMRAGRHLRDMIESVLDFASIESGHLEMNPALVSVDEQIEDCMAFIGPMAVEHMLELRTVRAHDAPRHIHADPKRLRQVLVNLLGNAVKYTPAGSVELRIRALTETGRLRLEIADTGPGIDEAHRSRMFQDFERFDANTSLEGAGLGLSIAARVVNLMKGAIGYYPNTGGGSVFWLEMPIGESAAHMPVVRASAEPAHTAHTILLVEDVAMNRDVIGGFLRAAGHDFATAENGFEAIAAARETRFDLILMDIRMPRMDGMEATRQIRRLPGPYGEVPIVALTAHAFPDQVAQALAAGMNGHVAKPADYATLRRAIQKFALTDSSSSATVSGDGGPLYDATEIDSGGPLALDRARYDETVSFLPPASILGHLQQLRARGEQILRLSEEAHGPDLTDAAHTLASSAGMFGLQRLSEVARAFEHAAMRGDPARDTLAGSVRVETLTAIAVLDGLMLEQRARAA